MSELTREEIEALEPINAQLGELAWPYGSGRVLKTNALALYDRAERAEADKAQLLSVWQTHVNTLSDCVEKLEDERDALKAKLADYEGRRWYSAEMMDAVVTERDALKAEVERLDQYTVHLDWCPLAQWSGGSPTADGNYESCFAGTWYRRGRWPKCTCGLDKEATDE